MGDCSFNVEEQDGALVMSLASSRAFCSELNTFLGVCCPAKKSSSLRGLGPAIAGWHYSTYEALRASYCVASYCVYLVPVQVPWWLGLQSPSATVSELATLSTRTTFWDGHIPRPVGKTHGTRPPTWDNFDRGPAGSRSLGGCEAGAQGDGSHPPPNAGTGATL